MNMNGYPFKGTNYKESQCDLVD
jgi:hypothetical protein